MKGQFVYGTKIIRLPFAGDDSIATRQKEVYFPDLEGVNNTKIVGITPLYTSGGAPLAANDTIDGVTYENLTPAQLSLITMNLWEANKQCFVISRMPLNFLINQAPFITNPKYNFKEFGHLVIDWTKSYVRNTANVAPTGANPLILQLSVNFIQ